MNAENTEETAIAKREPRSLNLSNGIFFDSETFKTALEVAKGLAASDMVPAAFKGKPGNVLVALDFAARAKISPLAVMRGMYLVHGNPAFEGQFVIGLAKQQRAIKDLEYKIKKNSKGEVVSCIAIATHASTGKQISTEITWNLVTAEGWDKDKKLKTGGIQISKWKTMREHMFKLRAGAWLVREYCPEVSMGLPTPDEVEDSTPEFDVEGDVISEEELGAVGEETEEESGEVEAVEGDKFEGEIIDPPGGEEPVGVPDDFGESEKSDNIFGGKF